MKAQPRPGSKPRPRNSDAHRARRFIAIFLLLFFFFEVTYYGIPVVFKSAQRADTNPILAGYARVCGAVLSIFGEPIAVSGRTIIGRSTLTIARSCDAVQAKILVISAIMAFPTSLRRRAIGAATAILLISVLNVIRIVSLYYVRSDAPYWFDTVHLQVWQPLLIAIAIAFFTLWALYGSGNRNAVRSVSA